LHLSRTFETSHDPWAVQGPICLPKRLSPSWSLVSPCWTWCVWLWFQPYCVRPTAWT